MCSALPGMQYLYPGKAGEEAVMVGSRNTFTKFMGTKARTLSETVCAVGVTSGPKLDSEIMETTTKTRERQVGVQGEERM